MRSLLYENWTPFKRISNMILLQLLGKCIARSSNGRTSPSGGEYLGSSPGLAAIKILMTIILAVFYLTSIRQSFKKRYHVMIPSVFF